MVSVVIPVFNRPGHVIRAIRSVCAQTFKDLEIIVVDDGSTDGTGAVVRCADSSQVRLLTHAHSGVSAARNLGIRASQFDWVAFLDSDDEWLTKKLENQITALKSSNLFVCHTNEIWIKNGIRVNPCKHHEKAGGDIFLRALPRCMMSPSSIVIHKKVFAQVGYFDESFPTCEDYDLFLRITLNFPVCYLDQRLIIKYGGHSDQLSHVFFAMDRFRVRALDNLLIRYPDMPVNKKYTVIATLLKKAAIVKNGAEKRKNITLMEEMQYYIDQWQYTDR